jgi:hypothetical protein
MSISTAVGASTPYLPGESDASGLGLLFPSHIRYSKSSCGLTPHGNFVYGLARMSSIDGWLGPKCTTLLEQA